MPKELITDDFKKKIHATLTASSDKSTIAEFSKMFK